MPGSERGISEKEASLTALAARLFYTSAPIRTAKSIEH
jgi:hypothetical protein